MAFCGKCGAPLKGEKFCPNCGAETESDTVGAVVGIDSQKTSRVGLWKVVAAAVVVIAAAVFVITRFTATVNEPCVWCGNSPSIAYEMHDGSYSYVCKDCSKKCAWCGEKATKHYENLYGVMVFVCDDCYEGLHS